MIEPSLRGKYRTTRLLGEGGMGSVFEAEDTTTGARIALKVMRADIAKSTVFMARFEREVRASQAIRTPYIVEVLDAGTDERSGEPFMAMELLEGEDLKHVLRRTGPLHPMVALKIAAQACLGLQAAHEQRIVHRDIKSANLFLAKRPGGERIVKLLDFGIAKEKLDKEMHAETAGLTRTGNMLGSPLYMSPEQVRGHKSIDHRADLWSLGIVLYEALAGRTPHQDAETLGELIITICSELPRPVQEFSPWVPPSIAAILAGAIRFDPAERFPTAAAMFEAMAPLLQGDLTITDEMLRPLTEEERSHIAPRLPDALPQGRQSMQAVIPAMSSSSGGQQPTAEPWRFDSASWPGASPSVPPQAPFPPMPPGSIPPAAPSWPNPSAPSNAAISGTTFSPTSESVRAEAALRQEPKRSRGAPFIIAGAALSLLAGGFAGFQLITSSDPPPAPAATPTEAPAATSAKEAPSSAPAEDVKDDPKQRVVSIEIIPANATVVVDGQPVTPEAGRVAIKGALGSTHSVRVSAGGHEMSHQVAVTENGAFPPKIEIVPAAPKAGFVSQPAQPTAKPQPTRAPSPSLDLRTNR
ncbi:MAG: serine/threonine protein kinase [Polyangiaceae bacterium]|nr:serine/threonine protein kinase [Polyangiaceae bacterium]